MVYDIVKCFQMDHDTVLWYLLYPQVLVRPQRPLGHHVSVCCSFRHIAPTVISDRIVTMTLHHTFATMVLDDIDIFGTIIAFNIPWLFCWRHRPCFGVRNTFAVLATWGDCTSKLSFCFTFVSVEAGEWKQPSRIISWNFLNSEGSNPTREQTCDSVVLPHLAVQRVLSNVQFGFSSDARTTLPAGPV
jgi:hypothetical protein